MPEITPKSSRPRTLQAWLDWQEHLNPKLIDLGLDRLRPVAARLGLAAFDAPLITVAGTNGKGSIVAYLEALARAHGLRCASYVSPWLLRYNESVRVEGEAVEDGALLHAFEQVEAAREGVALTAFEYRTLAAAHVIRAARPDLAVLEVGMGGRLDAVNLFDPDVSVISSVGLDHCEWLGHTLDAVAREKAGIFRRGRPAVCADPRCTSLIEPLAAAAGARLWRAGREIRYGASAGRWWLQVGAGRLDDLPSPALEGAHQHGNAAAAIAAFELSGLVPAPLDGAKIGDALRSVRLRGRLERLPGDAERRVDVAHNPHAAAVVAAWIAGRFRPEGVRAVCAMYADKDLPGTLEVLAPHVGAWYLAGLPPPRGAAADALSGALAQVASGAHARSFESVEDAWRCACRAPAADLVIALGSFETARRVLRLESGPGSPET